jgi:hypothetical protein
MVVKVESTTYIPGENGSRAVFVDKWFAWR